MKNLTRLDAADTGAAAAFANDVIKFVSSDKLSYKTTVPLAGITIAASRSVGLSSDGVLLRALSEAEQGIIWERWNGANGLFPVYTVPEVALELITYTKRDEQDMSSSATAVRWLSALQLHGYTIAGRAAQHEAHPKWFLPATSQFPLQLPSTARSSAKITPIIFKKVAETAKKLKQFNVTEPRSVRDFALHRFSLGASRQSSADALVDFVVALESLLLPYDSNTRHADLSYRFRVHGAHYLAKTKRERPEIDKQLRDLYNLRSRLVHGNDYPKPSDIETGRVAAQDLAQRGLLRAVSEGFPKAEIFKAMALGV